jgi:hypothetical protein
VYGKTHAASVTLTYPQDANADGTTQVMTADELMAQALAALIRPQLVLERLNYCAVSALFPRVP